MARLSSIFLPLCALAQTVAAAAAALAQPRAAADRGYLSAVFKGDVPHVFFYTAPSETPTTFQALSQGVLVPTQGTRGARDPYIVKAPDASKYYVLATDLDIGQTDWDAAQRHGSRGILIWESSDGVRFSGERLVELMGPTAGYVWAPSALWDDAAGSYAVFWASQTFAATDTEHSGAPDGPYIFFAHTSDFRSFTAPKRWDPEDNRTVIDQEITHLGGSSFVRYLSDTADVRRVVLDRSDNGLFGDWERVGVPVDQVREGPVSFRDLANPSRYYLWEDFYTGSGYECYYTETFTVPYAPCEPGLSPAGMRHGAVVTVDSITYNALVARG